MGDAAYRIYPLKYAGNKVLISLVGPVVNTFQNSFV
jgi:hypothetical protein